MPSVLASEAHVPAALLKQLLRELYITSHTWSVGVSKDLNGDLLFYSGDDLHNEAIRVGDDPKLAAILVEVTSVLETVDFADSRTTDQHYSTRKQTVFSSTMSS